MRQPSLVISLNVVSGFVAHEYLDRSSMEIPFFTNLVFKKSPVRFLHPLRKIAEENESRHN